MGIEVLRQAVANRIKKSTIELLDTQVEFGCSNPSP